MIARNKQTNRKGAIPSHYKEHQTLQLKLKSEKKSHLLISRKIRGEGREVAGRIQGKDGRQSLVTDNLITPNNKTSRIWS